MKNRVVQLLVVIILLSIPLLYATIVYNKLPETIPIHFDLRGNPDGFGSRSSIFLGPLILGAVGILTFLLITNLASIDPKRYQKENGSLYLNLGFMLVVFLTALGMIIVQSSVSPGNLFIRNIFSLLGFLFIGLGYFMPSIRPNYFVGLRLPWTLESEENWKATHQLAGKWWMIGGVIQVISGFVLKDAAAAISFFIIMAIMIAVPAGFSFMKFKRDSKNE